AARVHRGGDGRDHASHGGPDQGAAGTERREDDGGGDGGQGGGGHRHPVEPPWASSLTHAGEYAGPSQRHRPPAARARGTPEPVPRPRERGYPALMRFDLSDPAFDTTAPEVHEAREEQWF